MPYDAKLSFSLHSNLTIGIHLLLASSSKFITIWECSNVTYIIYFKLFFPIKGEKENMPHETIWFSRVELPSWLPWNNEGFFFSKFLLLLELRPSLLLPTFLALPKTGIRIAFLEPAWKKKKWWWWGKEQKTQVPEGAVRQLLSKGNNYHRGK